MLPFPTRENVCKTASLHISTPSGKKTMNGLLQRLTDSVVLHSTVHTQHRADSFAVSLKRFEKKCFRFLNREARLHGNGNSKIHVASILLKHTALGRNFLQYASFTPQTGSIIYSIPTFGTTHQRIVLDSMLAVIRS